MNGHYLLVMGETAFKVSMRFPKNSPYFNIIVQEVRLCFHLIPVTATT